MSKLVQIHIKYFFVVVCAFMLVACSNSPHKKKMQQLPDIVLYDAGRQALKQGEYQKAIENFKALDFQHPFGSFAVLGQLDLAYAYLKSEDPENAHAITNRFIRLHSDHPNVDYAYYLRGLSSYFSSLRFVDRYLPVDSSERDPGDLLKAFTEFSKFIVRFPHSPYVEDARQRMIAIKNQIARGILNIANYYMKRHAYVAAVSRGNEIVSGYQGTSSVEPALGILIEGYNHLGLTNSAAEAMAVLQKNFPKTKLLDENGEFVGYQVYKDVNPSVMSIISFGLFKDKNIHHKVPAPPKGSDRAHEKY